MRGRGKRKLMKKTANFGRDSGGESGRVRMLWVGVGAGLMETKANSAFKLSVT